MDFFVSRLFIHGNLLETGILLQSKQGLLPVFYLVSVIFGFLLLGILLGQLIERKKRLKIVDPHNQKYQEITHVQKHSKKEHVSTEEELRMLNATKDKFFSIIAHDLKNPFNSLLGFSELLKQDFDSYEKEDIKRFIGIIHDSSRHGFNLLENLLQWSRSQTDQIAFIPEWISLNDILKNCIELLSNVAGNKQIKIYHDLSKDLMVYGDIEMLSTVFRNLLSNAIKFTPRQGRIKIRARSNNRYTEISVVDTGVGIPEEKISDLFRIEKQVNSSGTENMQAEFAS